MRATTVDKLRLPEPATLQAIFVELAQAGSTCVPSTTCTRIDQHAWRWQAGSPRPSQERSQHLQSNRRHHREGRVSCRSRGLHWRSHKYDLAGRYQADSNSCSPCTAVCVHLGAWQMRCGHESANPDQSVVPLHNSVCMKNVATSDTGLLCSAYTCRKWYLFYKAASWNMPRPAQVPTRRLVPRLLRFGLSIITIAALSETVP